MSENDEYPAYILFSDLQQAPPIAFEAKRSPFLHGVLTQHQTMDNGQHKHKRHAQANSVTLSPQFDLSSKSPLTEPDHIRGGEGGEILEQKHQLECFFTMLEFWV
ncbi:Uncharacterized protein Fot_54080 [Forsythia ovata]|uniref:Uncharacterized protein n=1 Tax=Forsythia ovata TaxID=205694 RepID=A0ABD1PG06_9LAMI